MFSDMDRHMPISIWRRIIEIGVEIIDQSLGGWPDEHQAHLCFRIWLQNEVWSTVPLLAHAPNTGMWVRMLKWPCSAFLVGNCVVQWPGDDYFKGNHSRDFACTAEAGARESEQRIRTIPVIWMASKIHLHKYVYIGKSPGARRLFVFISVPKIIRKA